jgi:hypothetical protein
LFFFEKKNHKTSGYLYRAQTGNVIGPGIHLLRTAVFPCYAHGCSYNFNEWSAKL